jgi:nucleotide-binding universal stress UspA family protein
MFARIIVPLDGSSRAEYALPVAARIARASGGSLHLLQVVSPPIDYGGGLAPVPLLTDQVIETGRAEATDYLEMVATSQMLVGIHTTTEVMFGTPALHILAAAESCMADLIVICSRGRTGFTRWVLGSVAYTLAHESAVPVLILRESEPASLLSRSGAARPLCALVPLDGSQLAEAALLPAAHLIAALAAPTQAALHLAQVVKIFPATAEEGFVSELNEEALQRARTYLAAARERLQATVKDLKLSITYSVELETDAASALLSLAEHRGEGKETEAPGGCDLIAITTHGRAGLERWVIGSVTDRLLNTTRLPMLIVRPQKKE